MASHQHSYVYSLIYTLTDCAHSLCHFTFLLPNRQGPQQRGRDERVRLPRQHSHFSASRAAAQDHFRPQHHRCSRGQESENQTSGTAATSFSGHRYWSERWSIVLIACHECSNGSAASAERAAAYLRTCSARRRVRCDGNLLFLALFFSLLEYNSNNAFPLVLFDLLLPLSFVYFV